MGLEKKDGVGGERERERERGRESQGAPEGVGVHVKDTEGHNL